MTPDAAFWDVRAEKYAQSQIKDMPAYEHTLERVRSHLGADDRVLELGCGTGSTALLLAPSVAEYVGTDLSGGMIDIANRKLADTPVPGLRFETADTDTVLVPGREFDAILGFNLLHLVFDPADTFRRMHAALKPGGLAITKTPCLKGGWVPYGLLIGAMQLFGKAPHVGSHRTTDIDHMARDAGFEIVETGDFPRNPPSHFVVARKL